MHIHEAHAAHWPILQLKSKGCTLFAAAVGIIRSAAWGARTQHAIGHHVDSIPVIAAARDVAQNTQARTTCRNSLN